MMSVMAGLQIGCLSCGKVALKVRVLVMVESASDAGTSGGQLPLPFPKAWLAECAVSSTQVENLKVRVLFWTPPTYGTTVGSHRDDGFSVDVGGNQD